MALPSIPLPTSSIKIDGYEFEIRGLTRSESLRIGRLIEAGDKEAAENFGVACGTNTPEDETRQWRNSVPSGVVQELINEISKLSGLFEGADKSS